MKKAHKVKKGPKAKQQSSKKKRRIEEESSANDTSVSEEWEDSEDSEDDWDAREVMHTIPCVRHMCPTSSSLMQTGPSL